MIKLPLLFLLLITAKVTAETSATVKTELITFSMDETLDNLYLYDGENPVHFRSVPGGISMPIPYEGPAQLVLQRSPEAFRDDLEETPEPAAVVNLPLNCDRILLITFNKANSSPKIQAVPASLQDTGGGEYLFFNFSNRKAFISLNDQTISLAPKQSQKISGPTAPPRIQDLEVQIGSQTTEGPKVYRSVWGHRSDRRYLIFLLNALTPNAPLRIQRVHDRIPKLSKE